MARKSERPLVECKQMNPGFPIASGGGQKVSVDVYSDSVQVFFTAHDGTASNYHYDFTDLDKNRVLGEAEAFSQETGLQGCDPVYHVTLASEAPDTYEITVKQDVFHQSDCDLRQDLPLRTYMAGEPTVDPLTRDRTYVGHLSGATDIGTLETLTLVDMRFRRNPVRKPWLITEGDRSYFAFAGRIKEYRLD